MAFLLWVGLSVLAWHVAYDPSNNLTLAERALLSGALGFACWCIAVLPFGLLMGMASGLYSACYDLIESAYWQISHYFKQQRGARSRATA